MVNQAPQLGLPQTITNLPDICHGLNGIALPPPLPNPVIPNPVQQGNNQVPAGIANPNAAASLLAHPNLPSAIAPPAGPLNPAANAPQGIPGLPPAPQGLPLTMKHTTFAFFYRNVSKDPYASISDTIIDRFNPMSNSPQTSEVLLESAIGNPSVPGTFLCCSALHNNTQYRVYVLQALSKYAPAFDGRVTPWDNHIFGFIGDVLGENAQTIALPSTAFSVVQCAVYENARLLTELPHINDTDLLPWLTANAQDALVVQTRH